MIELSTASALTLYLLFCLAVVFGIWGWGHWRQKRKKIDLQPEAVTTCEFCQTPFLQEVDKSVSPCPECGLWNKK